MQTAIPATLMRGGSSKGLYFLADDLPSDAATRDNVLLSVMGSPDVRQIDGVGGAHPLTSKVAIVGPATRGDADVDYLFLQVAVDTAEVSDAQNCGNLLAGVAQFAIECRLFAAEDGVTEVRIHMVNTGSVAVARVHTPGRHVSYEGEACIDGVPGSAAPVMLEFLSLAGASCGALLPTGKARDVIDGVEVTCIDNGMPVVVLLAEDFGVSGDEAPATIEQDTELKRRIEAIRLTAGPMMNLGDVRAKTVPKMSLVSGPRRGGAISTRTFIPHRVHQAIGVLGAVSVATACLVPGSVVEGIAAVGAGESRLDIEHPSGSFTVDVNVVAEGEQIEVTRSALLRTARRLMSGEVFVPARIWGGT